MNGDQQIIAFIGVVLIVAVAATVYRSYLSAVIFGAPTSAPRSNHGLLTPPGGLVGPHYGRGGVPVVAA